MFCNSVPRTDGSIPVNGPAVSSESSVHKHGTIGLYVTQFQSSGWRI